MKNVLIREEFILEGLEHTDGPQPSRPPGAAVAGGLQGHQRPGHSIGPATCLQLGWAGRLMG